MKRRALLCLSLLFPLLFACKSPSSSSSTSGDAGQPTGSGGTISIDDFTLYFDEGEDGLVVADYVGKDSYVLVPASFSLEGKDTPVVGIAHHAFAQRKGIKTVTLGQNVRSIGPYAFLDSGVTTLYAPPTCVHIDPNAFADSDVGFNSYEENIMPAVKFSDGSGMGTRYLPYGDNPYALLVHGLVEHKIQEDCEGIADHAFFSTMFSNLTKVSLPTSIKAIGDRYESSPCFTASGDMTLESIGEYSLQGLSWPEGSKVTFDGDIHEAPAHCFEGSDFVDFTLKNGFRLSFDAIGEAAFKDCRKLQRVNCYTSVIPKDAFNGCYSLAAESFSALTEIGAYAFRYCGYTVNTFSSIDLSGLPQIGEGAFAFSSLQKVTLSNELKYIGIQAFHHCRKLSLIEFLGSSKEWEAVEKGGSWNMDCNRISVHCQTDDVTIGLPSTLV